jgi:2-succinyl-5-enolpyruvyl-6-hydroxy-3-cyclohexene-1-carboxylate synthase
VWLARSGDAVQILLDPDPAWQDPDAAIALTFAADPAAMLAELTERVERPPDAAWVDAWARAEGAAREAVQQALGDELSEPRVAAELVDRLPADAALWVASSMPVRDVETFAPARDFPPRMLSNRGANGIDGTVSSAFGAAAAGGGPVVALVGDVALAHDIGGLLAASRLGLKLSLVVLNNDGGGIFHFLPVAGEGDAFEEHIATPHGLNLAQAAALYGCDHELVETVKELGVALDKALAAPRSVLLEVRTDRVENVAVHRRVWEAVEAALPTP